MITCVNSIQPIIAYTSNVLTSRQYPKRLEFVITDSVLNNTISFGENQMHRHINSQSLPEHDKSIFLNNTIDILIPNIKCL